jgi:hypothetical protein
LKGNTSLEDVEDRPNKWITPNGWKDACKVDALGDVWVGFPESIKQNE